MRLAETERRARAFTSTALHWLPLVLVLLSLGMALLQPTPVASAGPHYTGPLDLSAQPGTEDSLAPQAQQEPQPPSPLLYLDIWLFGGLILLVMVVVMLKYLWKALQPDNRDPSEGLQPWEDPDYDHSEDEQ